MPTPQRWWLERRGSLRTLNEIAVHLGIQMLYDLIAGRRQQSRWLQLHYDEQGEIEIRQRSQTSADPSCPLCAKTGQGDDSLDWESSRMDP